MHQSDVEKAKNLSVMPKDSSVASLLQNNLPSEPHSRHPEPPSRHPEPHSRHPEPHSRHPERSEGSQNTVILNPELVEG